MNRLRVRAFALLAVVCGAAVCALAAPCRYEFSCDHANAHYRVGEEVRFTVKAFAADGARVTNGTITVKLDNFGSTRIGEPKTFDLAKDPEPTVTGSLPFPGFLRARASGLEDTGEAGWAVAVDAEKIRPHTPEPEDFDAFWRAAQEKLEREVPLDMTCTLDPEFSNAGTNIYRLSYNTFGGRLYGSIMLNRNLKRPYPVRVRVPGAGCGRGANDVRFMMPYDDFMNVQLTIFPWAPSISSNLTEVTRKYEQFGRDSMERYGLPWYQGGIDVSREDFLYYRVILGVNRAVNWLASQKQFPIDRSRFVYMGSSQGGGLGLALLALNRNFTRGCVHVSAFTDQLAGGDHGRQAGWPFAADSVKEDVRAAVAERLCYFDACNFSRRIRVPMYFTCGFADGVCPPAGVYAAYNVCGSSEKHMGDGIGMVHSLKPALANLPEPWLREPAVSFAPELTAFNPGEVTVGGEIGHHFDLTVGKILHHCDLENDFLRYFRERTPGEAGVEGDNEKNGGPYNGFVGIGMFLDGVVKACARGIGGAPLRTFKDKAIADLIATQGSDGSISVFTSIPKGRVVWPHRAVWDSHESAYILQALVGDYQAFGTRSSLAAAVRLADHVIEREEGINLGCETAFVMLWQATGDAKYRRWLEDHLVIAAPPEKYGRLLCACSLRHVYASLARAVAQLDYATAVGRRDPELLAFPQTLAGRLFGPYSSVTGSCTTGDGKREWGEIWGTAQYGTGKWGETCATAYAMRFSKKMLQFDPSTRWGDLIERATYNAFFAAQSEDGVNCRYFVPFEEQGEWWPRDTYCCPNNFRRWMFELADVVFLRTPEGVAVNLYSDATLRTDGLVVEMRTRYPEDGEVFLRVDAAKPLKLKLRIPRWSREPDAGTWRTVALKAGHSETRLSFKFEDRYVAGRAEQSGKVALMRGPLVYGVDKDGRRVRFSDSSRVRTYIPLPTGAVAVPDELIGR